MDSWPSCVALNSPMSAVERPDSCVTLRPRSSVWSSAWIWVPTSEERLAPDRPPSWAALRVWMWVVSKPASCVLVSAPTCVEARATSWVVLNTRALLNSGICEVLRPLAAVAVIAPT